MNSSTSEVGSNMSNDNENVEISASNNNAEDIWRTIFEQQNQNFRQLLKLMQDEKSTESTGPKKTFALPRFDPDVMGSDATSWCATADLIMAENCIEGSALIILLSKALFGSASQWLSTICFPGMKWFDFKELFLQRFTTNETPATVINNILNSRPKRNECLSVYGSRVVTSLLSTWKTLSKEEIAVSLALAHVASFDNRLNRSLFTSKVSTRNDLQQELKMFMNNKNSEDKEENNGVYPEAKRIKLSSNIKCHFCGNHGHKIAECKTRMKSEKLGVNNGSMFSKTERKENVITCFKCGQPGHIATRCPTKIGTGVINKQRSSAEKNVNLFTVEPKGVLEQSGEQFPFYLDTGAECSLIKEFISKKISGKRLNSLVTLRGIGNGTIDSTLQILSTVKINDYILEVLFHVVPDDCLKYDIVIGSEIIGMGFKVEIALNELKIVKSRDVKMCSAVDGFDFSAVNTELFGDDKLKLDTLLSRYKKHFIEGIPETQITTGQMKIRLIDPNKTVQRRPYRLSQSERETVRNRITELIDAKIIRPSCSPFSSPILLVKKKDGSDRMCVDYRELNANTVPDRYPLPLINDQIARLRGANYFTSLDMASGYHQVSVHPDSVEYTAFVTPDGQYEYLTMPFGLRNAPAVFQRAVMKALGDLVHSFVVVYMDDILIVANTKIEAFERLELVLNVLSKAGFSFNIKKCSFMTMCVQYLGYEVQAGEIRPNPRKINALTELPSPKSVTQLRQFIGLASYFRQFIPKFSQIMKPLYLLLSEKSFLWKSEHEEIRKKIVELLTNKPLLVIFDPQHPIELHCDASADGYGAILLHKIDGKSHVIEYFSKRTTSAESRYHSYELETLAVVNSIKHFRHYLQGRKFVVFTDCNSLKATRSKIELASRVHRWWAYLQSFDFDIQYKEGKHMAHADFLSRNHPTQHIFNKIEEKHVNLAEISSNWLIAEQRKDLETLTIIKKLENNELGESYGNTFEIRKNVLYRKLQRKGRNLCLPIVPRAFRWSIINNVHESIMHLGSDKTLDKIYDYFWFKGMAKYVRKFVSNCITCNLSKPSSGKVPVELHSIPKVGEPWHTLHVDITGKLSGKNELKEYVIVLVDAFTKFVFLYHTMKIDCDSCIRAIRLAISFFGVPSRVIADQGRCFTGKQFVEFCSGQNIKLHLIATGASRANGQVERIMSMLKSMLTAVESSNRSWQDALGEIQLAINCTTNRVTKASPLELFIGKVARPLNMLAFDIENSVDLSELRCEAARNIEINANYDKSRFDCNKAKIFRFNVGEYVLLKCEERHQTKLDPKYRGPFEVLEVLDNDRYILKSLNNKRTYKYSHEYLRKFPNTEVPEELDFKGGESSDDEVVETDIRENDTVEDVETDIRGVDSVEVVERDGMCTEQPDDVEKDVQ